MNIDAFYHRNANRKGKGNKVIGKGTGKGKDYPTMMKARQKEKQGKICYNCGKTGR